ncbi:hypothetical protein M9H77_18960 [Catharanthus roseus]|uniref:Uncharacterized protein n=1 Tax=Catharanthus roseus TaxID=4058 RepID=A0ACC0B8X0_CATRO|nr:hypothetical protein M9H77_18960 [Catharanthus roseus]
MLVDEVALRYEKRGHDDIIYIRTAPRGRTGEFPLPLSGQPSHERGENVLPKKPARAGWLYIQIYLRIYMLRLELEVPEQAAGSKARFGSEAKPNLPRIYTYTYKESTQVGEWFEKSALSM